MIGFFTQENTPEFNAYISFAETLGLNGPLSFFVSKVNYKVQHMAEFVGATKDKSVFIVRGYQDFKLLRFKFEGNISQENLSEFYKRFKDNKLTVFIKSAELSPSDLENVNVVVGSSFDYFVGQRRKHIVLAVVDQDCLNCIAVNFIH